MGTMRDNQLIGADLMRHDRARHVAMFRDSVSRDGARQRVFVVLGLLVACFVVVTVRLFDLMLFTVPAEPRIARESTSGVVLGRADIVDRNGEMLANNLRTASLFANPRKILDVDEAITQLFTVFPDLDAETIEVRLKSDRSFVWLRRSITPSEHAAVNSLGLPGLAFRWEEKRVYPHGNLSAHWLGFVDTENVGISGTERFFEASLARPTPVVNGVTRDVLELSMDFRVQHAIHIALSEGMEKFQAVGAAGIVMDVVTGEVLGLVSLPDFDSNHAGRASRNARFNRATLGVYEMGSVFKTFTVAMALDSGTATIFNQYDATGPMRIGKFTIHDDHPQNRWLTVPEVYIHSSNIGSARMALEVGADVQRSYLASFGLLDSPYLELPEVGHPLQPETWREINTVTAAYGHGIAVSPLQVITAVSSLTNGGFRVAPTLLKVDRPEDLLRGERVIGEQTSAVMRALMRQVVMRGTGSKADVPGYSVGGKTGTAERVTSGRYSQNSLITSFVAVFPSYKPRYAVFAMFEEPKGITETFGFAGAGWNAAPAVGKIIQRIAPLLGVEPDLGSADRDRSNNNPVIPVSLMR